MAVDRAALVAALPEFSDTAAYPDAQVTFWLSQAPLFLNAGVLGDRMDLATILFVAHNLVLSAGSAKAIAAGGGAVGATVAPVASKSVGPVSKSYDIGSVLVDGAGPWNATSYGSRLYQLLKAVTTGPFYVPGYPRTDLYGRRLVY